MTAAKLLSSLGTMNPQASLIFVTDDGDIGGDYHVTEFKRATVTGIDCAGRVSNWTEATLQLLDDSGSEHMSVGKFTAILAQSLARVEGLGDVAMRAEFAPRNRGLRMYNMAPPAMRGDDVVLHLSEDRAACKPFTLSMVGSDAMQCCSASAAKPDCCT